MAQNFGFASDKSCGVEIIVPCKPLQRGGNPYHFLFLHHFLYSLSVASVPVGQKKLRNDFPQTGRAKVGARD